MTVYYHGGIAGLHIGDLLLPSPPQVVDDCPVCQARAAGRTCTVGEYRQWLETYGPAARPALDALAGAPDGAPVDPPSGKDAVYITTSRLYASWYASRSRGDLYQVEPLGTPEPSSEDHFPSFTVPRARVVAVVTRKVRLDRRDRRELMRQWTKADRAAANAKTRSATWRP